MRHIRGNQLPKLYNLAPLEAIKNELAAITDPTQRAKFIRDNSNQWTSLRHTLWGLSGCKCWYSEALIQADQGHVEHYRPKRAVAGEDHPGYWWDAFEWTNYRLAHPTVNIRITDYLTGTLAGKGTYFPLQEGSPRAMSAAEEAREVAVLLDPTNAADCRLLCFELTSGKPIPRVSHDTNPWLHQRAADSIQFYHLDEGTWNVQRKDLVDELQRLCDQIERYAAGRPATNDEYELSLAELTERLGHMAEFSAVAHQVVRERGLFEPLHPLPGE